ncbi:MAG: GntR family transcriptional regulator [Bryobacteraceae bacterium]|jgi:DNA-binding GntR family transcriptional regulator
MKKTVERARPAGADSMRSKAYLHIQRKIATGELAAGGALSELALAKELGSSRTPIREAIGQLVAEGFLEQTPNRGAVVIQLSRQDIVELYELREALEVYAVGKAAREPLRAWELERLQSLADEILVLQAELEKSGADALDPRQMHRFMICDLGFHTLLMRMAGNARILKVVNETRLLIRIFAIRRTGHRAVELDQIHRHHREILDAVAGRQPERAMQLISDHIQISRRERLDAFDHWDDENSLRRTAPEFFDLPLIAESR